MILDYAERIFQNSSGKCWRLSIFSDGTYRIRNKFGVDVVDVMNEHDELVIIFKLPHKITSKHDIDKVCHFIKRMYFWC